MIKTDMTESRDPEFEKILREFAAFKESKTGISEITMEERLALQRAYNEEKNEKLEFKKLLKEFAALKESITGNSEITMQEGHELRDYYVESKNPAFQEALKDFSAFKEERTGNSAVTLAEKIAIYNRLLHKNILNI